MPHVYLRFYAELNDLLPVEKRMISFAVKFTEGMTLNGIIACEGVHLSDIDLILVNGKAEVPSYLLHDNDRISVYPVFESFDISGVTKVRDVPLRQPRFVLDVHLGKLASYLRMLGFDTLYECGYTDDELLAISRYEHRTLLSKDRELVQIPSLTHVYFVREEHPKHQLSEILHRFDLYRAAAPFTRCMECNNLIQPAPKESVLERLPQKVRELFQDFFICTRCDKIYWRGTHFKKMELFISDLLKQRSDSR
jgi:uncharacterized protein with PIN domain